MNNELLYITSHQLPTKTAHSLQIFEMSDGFNSVIKFRLISPFNKINCKKKTFYKWNKIKLIFNSGIFFKIEFCLKILSYIFYSESKNKIIFTRNIDIAFLCLLFNSKFIFEIHQSPKFFGKLILKLISKRKNFFLISISNSLKNYLDKQYNFFNETLVNHDAVNINRYERLHKFEKKIIRQKLKLDLDKKYLLYTGSFYKGLSDEEIIRILEKFNELNIICIGATKNEKKNLEKKINNKNLHILERIPKYKVIFYQIACDYLILPMKKKGPLWWCTSPLKLFEYMATKNLIISSDIGSIKEILNNKNCIIYSKDVIRGLNNALRVKDNSFVDQAFRDVRKKYTWRIRAKNILQRTNVIIK